MKGRRLAVFLALSTELLSPTGCGSSDGDKKGEAVALDSFIVEMAAAMCAWQFRCCDLPEIDALGKSSFLTEEECRSSTVLLLDERLFPARIAMARGRLSLDEQLAEACVQAFTGGSCGGAAGSSEAPAWAKFEACRSPFGGKVTTGAACALDVECGPGSSCAHASPSGDAAIVPASGVRDLPSLGTLASSASGLCRPDKLEGQSCAHTGQCAPGLACRRTDFVCARPAAAGESCVVSYDDKGAPQASIVPCSQDPQPLLCVGGLCRSLPRDGEACLPASASASAVAFAPCDPAPALDLVCVGRAFNGGGICKRRATAGATCSTGDGLPGCAAPLACLTAGGREPGIGTCAAPPASGAPCGLDGGCAAPAVCYSTLLTCVTPGSGRAGASCTSDFACASLNCWSPPGGTGAGTCINAPEQIRCDGRGTFVGGGKKPPGAGP